MTHDDREHELSPAPDETEGAARAFERAYELYLDPLCRYVYQYVKSWDVARDLVSDAFAKLWLQLAAGGVVQHAQAFLYRTARNRAIDYLRRQTVRSRYQREREAVERQAGEPAVPASAEQGLAERELTAALQRAVDQLPPQQRQVVLLRWRGDVTNADVAAALGIAPNTASEHFHRALATLRRMLADTLRDRA